MTTIPVSVLDLPMIETDGRPGDILAGMTEVAQRVEQAGYRRLWFPEHHATKAIADFPPAIVAAHVAAATSTIRVGSGGVLAPNHVPLTLAEQFGALAALHPGRIDLGIGRGPGTRDQDAPRTLRRGADPTTDEEYGQDVANLLRLTGERAEVPEPWLLASSTAGAELAARLGLPMTFGFHLRPGNATEAIEKYRNGFRPSRWARSPRVIVSVMVFCADTAAQALHLARPSDLMLAMAALDDREIPMPTPDEAAAHVFTAKQDAFLGEFRAGQILGDPGQVGRGLAELASRFDADELMLTTPVYDAKDRGRSFELAATAAR